MRIRKATISDIPAIVEMLANDTLGKHREAYAIPLPQCYFEAFAVIDADPHQELIVLENKAMQVIGTLQVSFIQYLTYQGGVRAQIEAVRVHEHYRNQGIGKYLLEWAIALAKKKKAHVVQLTTDKKRPDAVGFYEKLGFIPSHEGMKLHLAT